MGGDLTLVVGATGLLGAEIVSVLRGAGRAVRVLVRDGVDPEKRAELAALGVDVVVGDLKDSRSLVAACAGASAIVSTATATRSRREGDSIRTVDELGQLALVDAAERARVDHMVFVSFAPTGLDYALQRAKRRVEERIQGSALSFTILQPTKFAEVWLGPALGFDPLRGRARILGAGSQPVSWVSFRDVALFASAAVVGSGFRGKVLPLGGPDALSQLDVVAMFEGLGAPPVRLEYVSEAVLEDKVRTAPSPLEEAYAAGMLAAARGQVVDSSDAAGLLPGRMKSVQEYASETLAMYSPAEGG